MDARGTHVHRLTTNHQSDRSPTWSANGEQLLFWRYGVPYVMNADGSNERPFEHGLLYTHGLLPPVPGGVVWSPDGKRIAGVRFHPRVGLYVMDANGTRSKKIAGGGLQLEWSPDGTSIAFTARVAGNREIYVVDADGSELRRLTTDPAADDWPTWSPDGKRIAFVSTRANRRRDLGPIEGEEIYAVSASGGVAIRLTHNTVAEGQPDWSAAASK